MIMEKKYLVCLICCKEFKGGTDDGVDLGRKEENVESLQQFCEVILEEDKDELEGNGGFTCSKFLQSSDDNLSICRNCLDLVKVVTEARLSAKCVEESVEKLQVLLLRELRRLQGRLDMFWGEFEKMEETLVSGDVKLIENNLDGRYSRVNDGGKRLSRNKGKISQVNVGRKEEIFGFREKICQVFRDFHQFNKKLNDKTACNQVIQSIRTKPEKKRKSIPKPADKPHHTDKGLSSSLPIPPNLDELGGHSHDNDEDDTGNNVDVVDDLMYLDNFDDSDHFEDNQVETSPTDKRVSLRRRTARKIYEQESSDSDNDDEGEDYEPEVDKDSKRIERKLEDKRRRPEKARKKDKRKSAKLEQGEEDHNSSDDEEFKLEEDAENISVRAKIYRLLREYEPHLAKLPPFKRNLVKSLLKRRCFNEHHQKERGAEKLNVFQRHMIHLSYNVETKLINLKDVPIKILCQADGGNGLICLKCELKIAESPKMETLMWEHVLSKHLNAYQCPHCKDKQYENHYKYNQHVYKCLRRREKVDKVECEICGKSLSDNRGLQKHKWGHMNENERKVAVESGLVKKCKIINKVKDKIFQCEQCGKSFGSGKALEKHEVTHQDRESREQLICPKCGKSFLRTGYAYHVKYDKSCGEDDYWKRKQTCGICGRILKNRVLLKRHMKDMHLEGDLKKWRCEICGKAFKKKMTLKLHETMHTGEKPWNCGKCGGAFSRQYNMKKHEATCAKILN